MRIKLDVTNGTNIFFISDLHLFHSNVIRFDNRPFVDDLGTPDVDKMHNTLIANWNGVVDKNDIVFYMGDLTFGHHDKTDLLLQQLNGNIHFIMGNHDKYNDIIRYNRFVTVNDYVDLQIVSGNDDYLFTLMHYPIHSWNKMNRGAFNLHGHCHHNLYQEKSKDFYVGRRTMDVGCNGINYTPISYLEVIEKLSHIVNEHH